MEKLPPPKDRVKGQIYFKNKDIVIWNGKRLNCRHNRTKYRCKYCNGSGICIHKRVKSQCRDCKGTSICIHSRLKSVCKECVGGHICKHFKYRSLCKECGGSALCKSPGCDTQKGKKYFGYCYYCYVKNPPSIDDIIRSYLKD